MTELLDKAVRRLQELPAEAQDDLARLLMRLAGAEGEVYRLSADEAASLAPSIGEAERGEYATENEIRTVWARHGL